MPTVEERAETLERAQLSAAHAASEFVETYQPDEGEETIAVSREAFDQLREAVNDWNFASNAFLAAERGNGSAPSREPNDQEI